MDAATFSTALFTELCNDLGFSGIDPVNRFNPAPFLDMFEGGTRDAAKRSLLCSVFKKSEVEVADDAEAVTLLSFLEANQACSEWERPLDVGLACGYAIDYARAMLSQWFEPQSGTLLECNMASIEVQARFGPGRSLKLGEKPSQYYFKIGDSCTTATSDFVRSWYDQSVQFNPLCEAAEMARKARFGPALLVDSGNISFVPKSYATKRTVMTEASLNTFFQLGLGGVMERVLRKNTGINLSCQSSKNSQLARQGSVEGSYATVDLKQCSDYIALGLVAYMFPKSVVQWVTILRTPSVNIEGLGKRPLFMTSTMGNGFTFPLQTSLLSAIVLGVYKTLDIPIRHPFKDAVGNYGVYGDDIVVETRAYPLLCEVLTALGMRVNFDKSFATGPFRESCGEDYHNGVDIRGVYIHTYTTLQDYFSIYNRLSIWAARQGVSLPATLGFIKGLLGREAERFIPPDESVDSGIIVPVPPSFEVGGVWKYTLYVPTLSSFSLEPWEQYSIGGPEFEDRRMKRWIGALLNTFGGSINEPAVLKTVLYGGVRRGKVIMRKHEKPKYRLVGRITPRWGYSNNALVSSLSPVMVDRWLRSLAMPLGV